MFPKICHTSKTIAFKSFAILYNKNAFCFIAFLDLYMLYCSFSSLRQNFSCQDNTSLIGNYYLYFFTTIIVNTFMPYGHVSRNLYECSMYSLNLKKLLLKLPKKLQTLIIENKKRLLCLKADAPKHATVKFCSITPNIVTEVTDAQSKYVPKELEEDGCIC